MRPTFPYEAEIGQAPSLVGITEIADVLSVTTSRVKQLRRRDDFPPPALVLAMGPAWWRADVEAWRDANVDVRARHDPRKAAAT